MIIVPAEEMHAEQIYLAQARAYQRKGGKDSSAKTETLQEIASRITDPNWEVFVGVENSNVISGISYFVKTDKAYVARLFSIGQRGSIGMNTFRESLAEVRKEKGIGTVFARVDSPVKCRAYAQEGFRIAGPVEKELCRKMIAGRIPERENRTYLVKTVF